MKGDNVYSGLWQQVIYCTHFSIVRGWKYAVSPEWREIIAVTGLLHASQPRTLKRVSEEYSLFHIYIPLKLPVSNYKSECFSVSGKLGSI